MLLSRSLLNVSPTQIFRQSQEDRNVSGATRRGREKNTSCGRGVFLGKNIYMCKGQSSVLILNEKTIRMITFQNE